MKQIIGKIIVIPEDGKYGINSERATLVEIEDEGAGMYVKIRQPDADDGVGITVKEWEVIQQAVEFMLAEIRKHEEEEKDGTGCGQV